jgi:hypothetical protein
MRRRQAGEGGLQLRGNVHFGWHQIAQKNNSILRHAAADDRLWRPWPDYRTQCVKNPHRKLAVLLSLVGVLTATSVLLITLAPPPLASVTPTYDNLWATGNDDSGSQLSQVVFNTKVPARASRWKYIYVHQTGTATGNSLTLAGAPGGLGDHFLIGNGLGCPDGQIQMCQRWMNQADPAAPAGAESIDPTCISIALVGNFSFAAPTETQVRRLAQLIVALQSQLGIGADRVVLLTGATGPAGMGKLFPVDYLRQQLLP